MASSTDITHLKASAKDNAASVYAYGQRQINRVVSPDARQKAFGNVASFAQERPLFFAFLVSQLLFSSLPVLVFAAFCLSAIGFALGAAVIFSLFWMGIALLVLVPVLFFTCTIGVLVWVWAAGSFVIAKWLYEMSPVNAKGGLEVGQSNGERDQIVVKHEA